MFYFKYIILSIIYLIKETGDFLELIAIGNIAPNNPIARPNPSTLNICNTPKFVIVK